MAPAGKLQVTAEIKEALVDELRAQTRDIPVTQAFVDVEALEYEFQHGMAHSVVASLRVFALDDWCRRNA